jgi:hypothetical protein
LNSYVKTSLDFSQTLNVITANELNFSPLIWYYEINKNSLNLSYGQNERSIRNFVKIKPQQNFDNFNSINSFKRATTLYRNYINTTFNIGDKRLLTH